MKKATFPFLVLVIAATIFTLQQSDGERSLSVRRQCTSFCLDNEGYAVFGSNFDYGQDISEGLIFVNKRNISKSYWQADAPVNHARWTSKYGSVSFNLVMSQLSWAGMNEAGLVISTMQLDGGKSPEPDHRPWIYSNYWLQYVLDTCSTVEEVVASDSSIRISDYVDHYLLSDRFGHCATVEFLDGKMVAHTGKDLPVKVLANNRYERSVDEWKKFLQQKNSGESVSPGGVLPASVHPCGRPCLGVQVDGLSNGCRSGIRSS
jgi:choloylglycine hydrolase